MDAPRNYRIGEIAERTGVSVETLRYYEKRRLLNAPRRTEGGFRLYSNAAVHQVKFIKQAQSLGLTLDDIHQLAADRLRTHHAPSCRRVRDLLTRRIEDIDARIKELREFRRTLHDHLGAVPAVLQHADDAADRPLGPAQPLDQVTGRVADTRLCRG